MTKYAEAVLPELYPGTTQTVAGTRALLAAAQAAALWHRLLQRSASESGRLCRGDRPRGAADAAGEC
jgi:hypothetical protein